tara:strand:+ start:123 stop:1898 length:1776 start_codon:yes stop_codon:yes gene_type:complete
VADRPQFIDRINNPQNYPYIQNEDGSVSSHRMAAEVDEGGNWSVFPTIQMIDGKLKQFDDNRTAMRSAFETGNYLPMDSAEEAIRYAEGGYKVGTPMDPSRREAPSMRNLTPSQEANLSGATSLRRFVNPEVQARPDMITPIVPTLTDRARNLAVDVFGNSPVGRRRTQTAMRALETIDPGFLILDEAQRSWNEGNIGESLVGTAIGLSGVVPGVRQAGKAVKAGAKGVTSMRSIGGDIPVVTRDTPLLGRVGDAKSVNEMNVQMTSPELTEVPLAKAEDLIDRPYITGMSDTSRSGLEVVQSIDGVDLTSRMLGGKYWGFQPENIEKGQAFASAEGAITGQLNRANLAQELGNRPVAFIPYGMMGSSPDFATMTTELMVPYAKQVMSKSDKAFLDKRIREGSGKKKNDMAPLIDWPGIDNASEEYLTAIGGGRKIVSKALDEFSNTSKSPYRGAGSLSRSQARTILTDPDQFAPAFGDIDAIYELDPKSYSNRKSLIKGFSSHPSYPSALAGKPIGALRSSANIMEFDPLVGTREEGVSRFLSEMEKRGYEMPIGGKLDSAVMKAFAPGGHGVIDQAMVDDLIARGLLAD